MGHSSEKSSATQNGWVEKRKFKRIYSSAVLVFRPLDDDIENREDRQYRPADSFDLSMGGLSFTANFMPKIGSLVKIRLRLFDVLSTDPDVNIEDIAETMDFVVVAKVLRVEKMDEIAAKTAVQYVSIMGGDVESLEDFIARV